jgi:hypothetical protein
MVIMMIGRHVSCTTQTYYKDQVAKTYTITNIKTIAKLEKYKKYGIDTNREKSRDFDLLSLAS